MALNVYLDAAATKATSPSEFFIGDGTTKVFTVTKFPGSGVAAVYLENRVAIGTVSFGSGVSSALAGLPPARYVGYAAYHQVGAGAEMLFRGYVTGNTATTITLSDLTYTAAADALVLVSYAKQSAVSQYGIVGNNITFVNPPAAGSNIYAVGAAPITINFGGVVSPGTPVTTETKIYLKRDPGYVYGSIQISSDNLTQTPQSAVWVGATIAGGVITLAGANTFNAVNSEVGKAVNRDGVFLGEVVSNTSTTATLTSTTTNATAAEFTFYTVGELLIAPDAAGVPGTYAKVLQGGMGSLPATITTDTVYPVWVKGTVPVPGAPANYSENIIKVAATEYLE